MLKRCKAAQSEIRRLELRIRQREDVLTGLGGMRMNPNGGSRARGDPDRMGAIAAEIDEIERQKQARADAWKAEAASAMALLDMLPETESGILHRYYLLRESTGEIAVSLRRESSYVRKKKRDGEEIMRMLSAERVAATLPAWYLRDWPDETERRRTE